MKGSYVLLQPRRKDKKQKTKNQAKNPKTNKKKQNNNKATTKQTKQIGLKPIQLAEVSIIRILYW